jgi:hypothetical protein
MKLTKQEHLNNAHDWISLSSSHLKPGDTVDRIALAEQMQYTNADNEDIEAIAQLIEHEIIDDVEQSRRFLQVYCSLRAALIALRLLQNLETIGYKICFLKEN